MFSGLSIFWLAFAVSLDSFGAGTTYGMRGVRIPFTSVFIIAVCSGCVVYLSMWFGQWLAQGILSQYAHLLGASIFIVLGVWGLYQGMKHDDAEELVEEEIKRAEIPEQRVWTVSIRSFGLVIQILKTPMAADVDRSGTITSFEAFLLGLALSLDALGAGIGAALMGLPSLLTSLVIVGMCACFLYLGMWLGFYYIHQSRFKFFSILPGIILIILGLLRFL